MVPGKNGASGEKNSMIPETTISMDFHATWHLIVTFIMIEFFGLCHDIKKVVAKHN